MKTISNKFFNLIILTLLSFLFVGSFAHADAAKSDKSLALNFSLFNFLEGKDDTKSDEPDTKTEGVVSVAKIVEPKILVDDKNSCEHFDNISTNVLGLESASAETKQKIENVEDTLDSEATLRDSILGSVKNFFGLQKKDKVVFADMKKDISDAKSYYSDLDDKLVKTETFLDENDCDMTDTKISRKVDNETQVLVDDEGVFRKKFVASLKDKMKVLQDGVKEAKK